MLVMRSGHSRNALRVWINVEWFIREGKHCQRHRERVEEVSWTREEIRRDLREAGFDSLRAWDATPFFPHNSLVTRGCHTIYLARKEQ